MPKEVNRALITAAITVGLVLVVVSLFSAAASLLSAIAFSVRSLPVQTHISAAGIQINWVSHGARLVFDAIQAALGIGIVYLGICMRNPKYGLPASEDATTSIVSTTGYRLRGLGALALAGMFFLWSAGHTTAAITMMGIPPQTQLAMSHMIYHFGFYRMWSFISDAALAAADLCAVAALINLSVKLLTAARAGALPEIAASSPSA